MSRPLNELLTDTMLRYPVARREDAFGRTSGFWPVVGELKAAFTDVQVLSDPKRTKVVVSFGKGNWAEIPNVAIMDKRETERPSAGIYMVYLIAADGTGLILSLNQGSADLLFEVRGRAFGILKSRAERAREVLALPDLHLAGFTTDDVELKSRGEFSRAYNAGNIVSKTYSIESMPDEKSLIADLEMLHASYQVVIPSSIRLKPAETGRSSSPWRR